MYRRVFALLLVAAVVGASFRDYGSDPSSSMVAVVLDEHDTRAQSIPDFVKERVKQFNSGTLPAGADFPLANVEAALVGPERVRTIQGLNYNVVARWLDPLGPVTSDETARTVARFGANCDYLAYFGKGWDTRPNNAPQFNGSGDEGWMWCNFEYVSNDQPRFGTAPKGQHLTLARHLRGLGISPFDAMVGGSDVSASGPHWNQAAVDVYIRHYKKQVGGAWFRVVRDGGRWKVDTLAANRRYDATSGTLLRVTGHTLTNPDHTDAGVPLPSGVVAGIMGDCSGGQSPWGTIVTAEENVQDYYGDLEGCWSGTLAFTHTDPSNAAHTFRRGQNISPVVSASASADFGMTSNVNERHDRDTTGYLCEMDPGAAPHVFYNAGVGHRKIGAMGRARWENAAFVTGRKFELPHNQPIVIYAANDRLGGRFYKWVSRGIYRPHMSRAEIRSLLDEGTLYVAQFDGLDNATGFTMLGGGVPTEAAPGRGRWIRLSVDNLTDVAPNAVSLGVPTKKVGEALKDKFWNGVGGFPTDNDVRKALFTAECKIGVMELNRPEDVEWNPCDPSGKPRLYVAFTKHTSTTALDQNGIIPIAGLNSAVQAKRNDVPGRIWAIQETKPHQPAESLVFDYFEVWGGAAGSGPFDAANPDNLAIDKEGGVWFGTDGNFGSTKSLGARLDAIYYLDLNPAHRGKPSFGKAFRVLAAPSDAEATGPCFSSDMKTLFFNVQHPGEGMPPFSSWPSSDPNN